MKRRLTAARLVDVLFCLGAGLVAVGVGLWSLPAGLVTGGAFCLAASILIDRGGKGGDDG